MTVYAWLQPVDRIWKVITDPEKGTMYVYNEKNELISEQKDLGKDAVLFVEENFFNIVATRLVGSDGSGENVGQKSDVNMKGAINNHEYNYMYA